MDSSSSEVHTGSLPPGTGSAASSAGSAEVVGKATRRRFTLAYKRKIVTLIAGLPAGEIGALLRREGLFSSHLTQWRHQLATLGGANTPEPKRGPKPNASRGEKLKVERLERELARSQRRLAQAEAIIEAQKKLCALLGLPSNEELP